MQLIFNLGCQQVHQLSDKRLICLEVTCLLPCEGGFFHQGFIDMCILLINV